MPSVYFTEVQNTSSNIVAGGVLDLQANFQKLCMALDPFSCNCY